MADLLRRLVRDRLALAGLVIVAALALVTILAPWIAPQDPIKVVPLDRLAKPSAHHLLGADVLGRDLLSRLLVGARWSLGSAMFVTASVVLIGTVVGLVAGYYGGAVDFVLMRVVDALLAFPTLLLALAVVGTIGPGLRGVIAGLIAVAWAGYARIVRGSVLAIKEREHVEAARASGAGDGRILLHHLLPGIVSPLLVLATLEMGQLVLALAGLSFLGLGARPPTPEWGAMLNDGRLYFFTAPLLRHSAGSEMAEAGVAIDVVQELLGHRSITSAQVYVHPSQARMRSAVEAVEELARKRRAQRGGGQR